MELTEDQIKAGAFAGASGGVATVVPQQVKEDVSIAALGGAPAYATQQVDAETKLAVTQAALGVPVVQSNYMQNISATVQSAEADKLRATLARAFEIIQNGESTELVQPKERNAGQQIIAQMNGDADREILENNAKVAAVEIKSWVEKCGAGGSLARGSGVRELS